MHFNKIFARTLTAKGALFFAFLFCLQPVCFAQITPGTQNGQLSPTPPQTATSAPVANYLPSPDLVWSNLSAQKQQSLLPLQNIWSLLSEKHQRKWLALAQNFPKMSSEDQAKLHSRMVEWAALKPKDRELARLNFAETKKLSAQDRAANWEAYQALSPDERQALADKARSKKAKSGAPSIKTTNNIKLTAIPPRRTAPESISALMKVQNPVNEHTLLPERKLPAQTP